MCLQLQYCKTQLIVNILSILSQKFIIIIIFFLNYKLCNFLVRKLQYFNKKNLAPENGIRWKHEKTALKRCS
jgi:hypothetical protein